MENSLTGTASSQFTVSDFKEELESLGLNSSEVLEHREIILKSGQKTSLSRKTFKIIDTCRLDNGRLIPLKNFGNTPISGIWGFIPAAGASSRYNQPIRKWLAEGAKEHIDWAIPIRIEPNTDFAQWQEKLIETLGKPKALLPCVKEGVTFLEIKCMEHQAMGFVDGQIFVVPQGYLSAFENLLQSYAMNLPTHCIEQGPKLSTIRFFSDGRPVRDAEGFLSMVPAGHGALVHLLPTVKEIIRDKNAHSLLIRNIDNIGGRDAHFIEATKTFLEMHCDIREKLNQIRKTVESGEFDTATKYASLLVENYATRNLSYEEDTIVATKPLKEQPLWVLLFKLFQLPTYLSAGKLRKPLLELLLRPLNTMGMVPNTGGDVGGSPVVIDTQEGPLTICLESPHISYDQREAILKDPKKATHFNPVFVASEISESFSTYTNMDNSFWILAEKTWKEHKVIYFETLLYELLGNSAMANTLFVEVPRIVFNPHKTVDDTIGHTLETWGFD